MFSNFFRIGKIVRNQSRKKKEQSVRRETRIMTRIIKMKRRRIKKYNPLRILKKGAERRKGFT